MSFVKRQVEVLSHKDWDMRISCTIKSYLHTIGPLNSTSCLPSARLVNSPLALSRLLTEPALLPFSRVLHREGIPESQC